jgi:hypothetical protein
MISRNSILALILGVLLTATAAVRAADVTPESTTPSSEPVSTVTISGHSETLSCVGLPQDEARRHAQNAQRTGAHLKAAECFRIAGDLVSADRAQLRASADTGAASAQRIKASAETTKAQVKRLREAFRNPARG